MTSAAHTGSATSWGLLSTARINQRILAAARLTGTTEIVAVASRDGDRAAQYAEANAIPRAYGSYDDLLTDDGVDAVYISLPNHLHLEWVERALKAGKHVLCEKPLSRDAHAVARAHDTADQNGKVLSEGFMWRHHPQTQTIKRLIEEDAIGRVVEVRCAFGFDLPARAEEDGLDWRLDPRLSPDCDGGALMDVGTYCVNAIRLVAGQPETVTARSDTGSADVDLRTVGELFFPRGLVSRFECSMIDPRRDTLEIYGEDGRIRVSTPFLCREPGIELVRDNDVQVIATPRVNSYQLQFDNLHAAICDHSQQLLGRSDAVQQAAVLGALLESAGTGGDRVPLDEPVPAASTRRTHG